MWPLWIAGGLLILFILLLCIPVEATGKMDTSAGKPFNVRISWLFGLLRTDIGRKRKQPGIRKDRPAKKRTRRGLREGADIITGALDAGGIVRQAGKLATGIFRRLVIREIKGDFSIGLEDPADTGMLFAIAGPVNAVLNLRPEYNVSLHPVFTGEDTLEGYLDGTVKVRPLELIIPVLRFLAARDVRRVMKAQILKKRKRRILFQESR